MKKTNKALSSGVWMLQSTVITILLATSAIQSQAQSYSLSARNTSIQIDVAGGTPGVSDWQINGVNQLNQQWYYYSAGSGPINSIDTIGTFSSQYENIGNTPFLNQTYSNGTVFVTTDYTLQSQPTGSGQAKLSTLIGLQNLSGTTQTFHFYIYSDFWLGNNSGNQNVQFAGLGAPYQVTQSGNGGNVVGTITGISGGTSDTVELQAGLYNGMQFGITNGGPTVTLNNTLSAGTGNVNFAYEVNATLTSGTAISFTELESVPEPSTLALVFSGMLVFGLYYGRKLASFNKVVKKASR
jgi:hypothetical protein